jgi:hypothetical protein
LYRRVRLTLNPLSRSSFLLRYFGNTIRSYFSPRTGQHFSGCEWGFASLGSRASLVSGWLDACSPLVGGGPHGLSVCTKAATTPRKQLWLHSSAAKALECPCRILTIHGAEMRVPCQLIHGKSAAEPGPLQNRKSLRLIHPNRVFDHRSHHRPGFTTTALIAV